jgi:hypothetical protein
VKQPLLDWPDDACTLEAVPPMELHLLLGLVNRLYDELDQRIFRIDGISAQQWADTLSVRRSPYHGSQFNGNECERLLDGVDILRQMLSNRAAFNAMPVEHALSCLRIVKQKCFGDQLVEGFMTAIEEFEKAYHALGNQSLPRLIR